MAKSKYPIIKEMFPAIQHLIINKGYSEAQLIEVLPISKDSFYRYKRENSDFSDLLKKNQEVILAGIEDGLYKKAMGQVLIETVEEYEFTVDEETEEEIITKGKRKVIKKQVAADGKVGMFLLHKLDKTFWGSQEQKENLDVDQIADAQTLEDLLSEEIEDPI